jgi:hypothetical protein
MDQKSSQETAPKLKTSFRNDLYTNILENINLYMIISVNDMLIKADNTTIRIDTNNQMRVCI